MELQPINDVGRLVTVPLGQIVSFGRQPLTGLTSPRISRQHVTLSASLGYDGRPQLLVAAHKRCWLKTQDGNTQELNPQQTAEALPGDTLYLVQEGGQLTAGFKCQAAADPTTATTTSTHHPPAAAAQQGPSAAAAPIRKRPAPGAPTSLPATTTTTTTTRPAPGLLKRSRSPRDMLLAPLPPDFPHIFQGCRLVVARGSGATPQLLARAAELGAVFLPAMAGDITHVIASFGITEQQVADLVAGAAPQQQPQHRQQEQHTQDQRQQQQEQQEQEQQQQQQQGLPAPLLDWFSAVTTGSDPQRCPLPREIHFVTPAWLGDSMAAGARRDERPYHIWLHSFQRKPGEPTPAAAAATGGGAAAAAGKPSSADGTAAAPLPAAAAASLTVPAAATDAVQQQLESHQQQQVVQQQHPQPPGQQQQQQSGLPAPTGLPAAAEPLAKQELPPAAAPPPAGQKRLLDPAHADTAAAAAQPHTAAAADLAGGDRLVRRRLLNPRLVRVQRCDSGDSSSSSRGQPSSSGGSEAAAAAGQEGAAGSGGVSSRGEGTSGKMPAAGGTAAASGGGAGAAAGSTAAAGVDGGGTATGGAAKSAQQPPLSATPAAAGAAGTGATGGAAAAGGGGGGGGGRYVVPGPDQLCPLGEPWGSGQRWIEPWDQQAAQDTLDTLLAHWHGQGQHTAAAPAAAAHPSPLSPTTTAPAHPQPPATNGICSHTACAAASTCIVAELRRARAAYSAGRRDEFRVKALERGIRAVEDWGLPLRTEEDVAALGLGAKTAAKVTEVVTTGRYARNAALEGDTRLAALTTFMQVWGVAEGTAERWYQAGARDLEQVAALPNLTQQQQVGLHYFRDFLTRIPRPEVAECERLVWGAVLTSLQSLTGLPPEPLSDRLHCRVMGSYSRGHQDCGDIDFIIAPGPAAPQAPLGPLLEGTLQQLAYHGYITGDMLPLDPVKAKRGPTEHVTWMGVWRGPSSPCARRIDIKLYPRTQLACAVNYFSSGQNFCRALRHWANTPAPALFAAVQALNPAGNAFKLNDKELVVVNRAPPGKRWQLLSPRSAVHQLLLTDPPPPTSHNPLAQHQQQHQQGAQQGAATAAAGGRGVQQGTAAAGGSNTVPAADLQRAADLAAVSGGAVLVAGRRGGEREVVVGPAVAVQCEADIFRTLGLAYVPPHMRNVSVQY